MEGLKVHGKKSKCLLLSMGATATVWALSLLVFIVYWMCDDESSLPAFWDI